MAPASQHTFPSVSIKSHSYKKTSRNPPVLCFIFLREILRAPAYPKIESSGPYNEYMKFPLVFPFGKNFFFKKGSWRGWEKWGLNSSLELEFQSGRSKTRSYWNKTCSHHSKIFLVSEFLSPCVSDTWPCWPSGSLMVGCFASISAFTYSIHLAGCLCSESEIYFYESKKNTFPLRMKKKRKFHKMWNKFQILLEL